MSHRVSLLALLLIIAAGACERAPTDPLTPPPGPRLDFTNAPAELPHVLRSGGRVISAFLDFENDYVMIVGAPDDPTTDRVCPGGSAPRQFIPVQWVGDFADVVKQLAILKTINIVVYQPIPESLAAALCSTEPIASGTGFYLRTDNDFFGAFGRANAVSERVHGTVTLADGGLARLSASFLVIGRPDGSILKFETRITLRPIGK